MVISEVRVMVDALKTPSKTARQINTYIAQRTKETHTVSVMDFLPKSTVSEKVKNINNDLNAVDQLELSQEGLAKKTMKNESQIEEETNSSVVYTNNLSFYSEYQLSQMLSKGSISALAYYDELDRRKQNLDQNNKF